MLRAQEMVKRLSHILAEAAPEVIHAFMVWIKLAAFLEKAKVLLQSRLCDGGSALPLLLLFVGDAFDKWLRVEVFIKLS